VNSSRALLAHGKHSVNLSITHNYWLAKANPTSMSVKRAKPLHMTMLPGGESPIGAAYGYAGILTAHRHRLSFSLHSIKGGAIVTDTGVVCASHSPLMYYAVSEPLAGAEIGEAFEARAAEVAHFKPDVIFAFGPDHYTSVFYKHGAGPDDRSAHRPRQCRGPVPPLEGIGMGAIRARDGQLLAVAGRPKTTRRRR
jgi:hypothetical protein